jgi:type I restriction enzyme S subunit
MTPAHLLAHFDRLADAPDAVPRLRRFVLDLAVRGKLVLQDPADEPAADLLKRIAAQFIKHGDKKDRTPFTPDEDEVPYTVPPGWTWSRFDEVASIESNLVKPQDFADHPHIAPDNIEGRTGRLLPYQTIRESKVFSAKHRFFPGQIVYSKIRPALAKVAPVDFEGLCSADMYPIRPLIDRGYLLRYMLSEVFVTQSVKEDTRVAMPKINQEALAKILVAVPPFAEQRRIVAKVDELMARCDSLEAAQTERESRRDRLVSASLQRLNQLAEDVTAFRDHARFALDNLPRLATRPEHVTQLRQTILNLAVRGKLVPQDPKDEAVSELLKRIEALEKPPRYASRSCELIVGDCGLSIGDPKTPLPDRWQRVPMVEIARLESGHTPSRNRSDWWGGEIAWMGLVDARRHHGGVITETIQYTNPQGIANSAARVLPAGTVCFSRTASVGYVVIMGKPMATSQDFVNWVPTEAVSSRWLQLVLIAEKPALSRFSKGAVHQTIYYPAWLSMHIVLPPLAEQHRIVAKVDELIALCDKLEAQLATAQAESHRLLEAVLHEALGASLGETTS